MHAVHVNIANNPREIIKCNSNYFQIDSTSLTHYAQTLKGATNHQVQNGSGDGLNKQELLILYIIPNSIVCIQILTQSFSLSTPDLNNMH